MLRTDHLCLSRPLLPRTPFSSSFAARASGPCACLWLAFRTLPPPLPLRLTGVLCVLRNPAYAQPVVAYSHGVGNVITGGAFYYADPSAAFPFPAQCVPAVRGQGWGLGWGLG